MPLSNNAFLIYPSPAKLFAILITSTVLFGCSSIQSPRVSVSGLPVTTNHVCVDVNESVPSGDLLRAIEISLHEEGISSTLYSHGTERTECKTTLKYSVHARSFDGFMAADSTEHWNSIDFSVVQRQIVVAVGRFESSGLNARSVPFEDIESMVHELIRPVPAVISSRSGKSALKLGELNVSASR